MALSVVLLHFGINDFAARMIGWNGASFGLAVDFFFILSGFVLTHSVRRGVDAREFVFKRIVRLAPVFFVTTLILVPSATAPISPLELLMAVPLTGADPLNVPAWSICWEFYLPVAALLVPGRVPEAWVKPALVGCLIAVGIFDIGVAQGESWYFARGLFGLLAGYFLYRSGLDLAVPTIAAFAVVAFIMCLAMYVPWTAVLLPAAACACVLAGRRGGSIFSTPPFQLLGTLSYTLYLGHIPVLFTMQAIWGDAVDNNVPAKLGALAATFVLAAVLTWTVELPAMRWGAARARRARPA